eukprot:TRINITY_DN11919_c0_g2_i1.p1 TRINITY_DN11919_c0_g2~~TRINITY_DN11919_c0_g2_i1.p1  ORF type:complete len:215 (+),score=30.09 TRINITY_DN11919_c0_g2_i1:98-646(+)
MASMSELKVALEALVIGAGYITVSASLITFNKYLMHEDRFPYARALTATHMLVTSSMSIILYSIMPSLYPTMGKAKENWRTLMKYLIPPRIAFRLGTLLLQQSIPVLLCFIPAVLQGRKRGIGVRNVLRHWVAGLQLEEGCHPCSSCYRMLFVCARRVELCDDWFPSAGHISVRRVFQEHHW